MFQHCEILISRKKRFMQPRVKWNSFYFIFVLHETFLKSFLLYCRQKSSVSTMKHCSIACSCKSCNVPPSLQDLLQNATSYLLNAVFHKLFFSSATFYFFKKLLSIFLNKFAQTTVCQVTREYISVTYCPENSQNSQQ